MDREKFVRDMNKMLYGIDYSKKNKDINPIRRYQKEFCLRCEEEGRCDYDKMFLCATIREYYTAEGVYKLKFDQMDMLKRRINVEMIDEDERT